MNFLLGSDVCRDILLGPPPKKRGLVSRLRENAALRSVIRSGKVGFNVPAHTLADVYMTAQDPSTSVDASLDFPNQLAGVKVLPLDILLLNRAIRLNPKYISHAIGLLHVKEEKLDAIVTRNVVDYQQLIEQNPEAFGNSSPHLLTVSDVLSLFSSQGFLSQEVKCYTPAGREFTLPRNSTPIDFAYYIHTEVGNHCNGARIKGHERSTIWPLEDGDVVEILTSKDAQPNLEWLKYSATSRAIRCIKRQLKRLCLNASLTQETTPLKTQELFFDIGDKKHRLAGCCTPLPIDDDIVGVDNSKGLVTIHRSKCSQLLQVSDDNLIQLSWNLSYLNGHINRYIIGLQVLAVDQVGVLAEVARLLASHGINIHRSKIQPAGEQLTSLYIWIEIDGAKLYHEVVDQIRELEFVIKVHRLPLQHQRL